MLELPRPMRPGLVASVVDALKYMVKMPYRAHRRAGIARRLPPLADGRGWRTAISPALHISIIRGMMDYDYRDVPMQKHPMDMALYTRLIWRLKPRSIIEIGSLAGGSAVWLGDTLKTFGIDGQVVSIDLTPPTPVYHPGNVKFLQGDQTDLSATLTPKLIAELPRPWLVIEDASHHYKPTLAVLRFFDPLLRSGEYIVIEDANMTEMGTDAGHDGGPARAICEFLGTRGADYVIDDRYCDLYGINVTENPNGYLRRK
jgi:cephalosporin hydroxylase